MRPASGSSHRATRPTSCLRYAARNIGVTTLVAGFMLLLRASCLQHKVPAMRLPRGAVCCCSQWGQQWLGRLLLQEAAAHGALYGFATGGLFRHHCLGAGSPSLRQNQRHWLAPMHGCAFKQGVPSLAHVLRLLRRKTLHEGGCMTALLWAHQLQCSTLKLECAFWKTLQCSELRAQSLL